MSCKNYLLVLIAMLLTTPVLFCQTAEKPPTVLRVDQSLPGELAKKEVESYQITTRKGNFVYGFVDQLSVDVVVTVFDPEGKKVAVFDDPAVGPEHFQFEAKATGDFVVDVSPFKDKEGDYSIVLKLVEPVAKKPQKRIDQLMCAFDNTETPGGVVGVIQDGKVIFAKGYGMANLVHGIPFTADLRSNIGSVSKQFTAFGILLLEKAGKLNIDDDVRKHIPELPDFGETVTLKNLLNHTNGYREIYNTMPIKGWKGEDGLLKKEAIRLIQRQKELQAQPGAEFNYNNTAYIFLAEIIARTSGQDFHDWMKDNVFEPLGMNETMVRPTPKHIVTASAQGYVGGEGGFLEAGDLHAANGAGTMYTTIANFAKWLQNFKDPKVGGAALIEKLTTPGILNSGDTMSYALGIGVGKYRGQRLLSHTGGDIAHRTLLSYYPDIDVGVVLMSNNGGFNLGMGTKVMDAFFADELEPIKEKKAVKGVQVDAEILKTYAGKYKAQQVGLIIEYKLENEQLVAYPTGQSPLPLVATSDTSFAYEGVEASLVFHVQEGKKIEQATHTQGGSAIKLERLPPFELSADKRTEYIGKYFCEELETFYTILLKEDKLLAELANSADIELTATEEDTFSGSVYFAPEIQFERDDAGQITGFKLSNGRTKGIHFERQE